MRFENRTTHCNIAIAISRTERLLDWDESPLQNEVYFKNDFRFNSGTGASIAHKLCTNNLPPVCVFIYRPFNPWTKAIAYFDGKAIHFNIRKLPFLTVEQITGTLLHEYAHYCGFTHGNNFKTKEKCLYSVPYYLSENVSRWL
jgi:hypothetical protein